MVHGVSINLTGKVALVTGGGYGMGRATALRFAESGAAVVVADVDSVTGSDTVRMIESAGGAAAFAHVNVGTPQGAQEMVDVARRTYGGLDFAHNNAGIVMPAKRFEDYPEEAWEDVIRTNLTGVFLSMKYEIPVIAERGGGAIINVASESTYKGNVADLGYTASKHGVVGLTTVAALQCISRNIRVNAVSPGNVDTGIIERARLHVDETTMHQIEKAQPIGRLSRPEEIAEIVVWLCTDSAVLVNGAKIAADTGWHVS